MEVSCSSVDRICLASGFRAVVIIGGGQLEIRVEVNLPALACGPLHKRKMLYAFSEKPPEAA